MKKSVFELIKSAEAGNNIPAEVERLVEDIKEECPKDYGKYAYATGALQTYFGILLMNYKIQNETLKSLQNQLFDLQNPPM